MSHHAKVLLPIIVTAALFSGSLDAGAQVHRRTTGITLRGGAWGGWPEGNRPLVFGSGDQLSYFDGDGVGGWISFVSRMNDNVLVELSLGAVVRSVEELHHSAGTDAYVEALVPLLLGTRVFPFEPTRSSALRPYLSFGAGPYWMADITSIETFSDHDVTVDSRSELGGYLGVGADFMISDWFGLNFDVKRHYVDFQAHHEYSGYEVLMGLQFMWGDRYRHRRGRRSR